MLGFVSRWFGGSFGIDLELFRGCFGIDLESLEGHFGCVFDDFLHFAQNRAGNAFPSSFCMKKCARVDSRKWFGPETLFLHCSGGSIFDIFQDVFVNSAFF